MKILLTKAAHYDIVPAAVIPLGILYIASYLRKYRPHDEIKIYDCRISPEADLYQLVRDWQPDVVGISAITIEGDHAMQLARNIKDINPTIKTIMGGPHPTAYNDLVLSDHSVDITILHEGELTFCEAVEAIETGRPINEIQGIGYRDDKGGIHKSEPRPYIDDLDTIPHPAWDLVDFNAYAKIVSMTGPGSKRRYAPIFTSRACPYRCTYCHDMFGKKLQRRSVENVLNEMEMLVNKYGIKSFEIIDDIFNIDRVRTQKILQGIIDRGLKIKLSFPNGLRGDLLTEDLVDLFDRAGTEFVSIAVESGSPRVQKYIRKHVKLDKVKEVVRWFSDRRIFTNCFFMMGFPTETQEELEQTVKYACSLSAHSAMFFMVTPFNETELAKQVSDIGINTDVSETQQSYVRNSLNITGTIPTKILKRKVKFAVYRFLFSDPTRVWRVLRDHPMRFKFAFTMFYIMFIRMFFAKFKGISLRDIQNHLSKQASKITRPKERLKANSAAISPKI